MTDKVLLEQALEALEEMGGGYSQNLIAALRERLAQPEQDPVAWRYDLKRGGSFAGVSTEYSPVKLSIGENWTPLYTVPQRRDWVGLTDEEADELVERFARYELLHAIEATLREKNT